MMNKKAFILSASLCAMLTATAQQVNDYIIVGNKDELRAAIKQVNANTSGNRQFIFMKNGDYDYGTYYNYKGYSSYDPLGRDTIKVDNVSLIGQRARHSGNNPAPADGSTEKGVLIHIKPTKEDLSTTAPIVNQGSGCYLQDFTIENDFKISGTARACCWHDDGNHTIGKNVCLLSYQDTYYAHKADGQFYWETSDLRGSVDFLCGNGDVFFNKCKLVNRDRQPYDKYTNQGEATLSAPYTQVEDFNQPGGHGFIFMDCTIDCESSIWIFGRGWRGWPKEAFINTTLTEQARLRLGTNQTDPKNKEDKTKRVSLTGIQTTEDAHYMQFYEYNTMDENGNNITPETNVLTFKAHDSGTYETVLQASEIDKYQLRNVYTDWTPDVECRQIAVTSVTRSGNSLSWTVGEPAKAFLIEQDGDFVAIVAGTENQYNVNANGNGKFTVRAANMMGGFGEPTEEGNSATGIINVNVNDNENENSLSHREGWGESYNLAGQKVGNGYKGISIVNGKKVINN
ncbi:MAG: hypothetical protein IJ895_04065 [Prevotella sp.]|nr:hypothetical protein [Prevotella sp.]